jgi:hypothetical protein
MWHAGHRVIEAGDVKRRFMSVQEIDAYPALRSQAQCRASVAAPLAPGPSPAALTPGSNPALVISPQLPAAPLGLQPGAAPLAVAAPAPSSGGGSGSASAGSAGSTASAPVPSSQYAAVSAAATGWAVVALMAVALPALL